MIRWLAFSVQLPCWPRAHQPLLTQKRDATGAVQQPPALVWTCRRCGKALGETVIELPPPRGRTTPLRSTRAIDWSQQGRLRRPPDGV